MSFLKHFTTIEDPRSHINQVYDFLDILFLFVSAVLSGAEGWKDIEEFGNAKLEWLRKFRSFESGIPVDDTIARLIKAIEPEQVTLCFIDWVNEMRGQQGHEFVKIDGKTLRHSFDGDRTSALHSITVWLRNAGMVYCQRKSEGKKNEIKSAQQLIEALELENTTVTLDAMHCQKQTARLLIKNRADYVLCVKGNQKRLLEELQWWFDGFEGNYPQGVSTYEETDAGHGRIEHRAYTQLPVTAELEIAGTWEGIQSVIKVERERHIGDKHTCETVYYISSHAPDAPFIAQAIRSHWEVENKVHWVLDVTYREDDCRIRKGNGAEVFAIIRRLCMNMARLHPKKDSMRAKLKSAAWDDLFREQLLFGIMD